MTDCILHLGSNIGFRKINLELALIMISNHIGEVNLRSSLYETEAWGKTDQEDFLNQAIQVSTPLKAQMVLEQIQHIESKMGRQNTDRWAPRIIDIDIIFYSHEIIRTENLSIPHIEIRNRNFVLYPLEEIIPEFKDPITGMTISELKSNCEDKSAVKLYTN